MIALLVFADKSSGRRWNSSTRWGQIQRSTSTTTGRSSRCLSAETTCALVVSVGRLFIFADAHYSNSVRYHHARLMLTFCLLWHCPLSPYLLAFYLLWRLHIVSVLFAYAITLSTLSLGDGKKVKSLIATFKRDELHKNSQTIHRPK